MVGENIWRAGSASKKQVLHFAQDDKFFEMV